ncbi:hypothetical protein SAMN04489760_11553 [Syntrophus gentianae]|uniref:Uncharacterized protein n=1 Tax=Syntrophus gentianae TaxID=43775 RepID=A0A1H7YDM7_9BACT|nr:hypothetical protein [Syntrophus gentianae]SEM43418.1 hypothetical protein SAMN04489760_11553 [Syntrophus gentianae]
MKTNRLFLSVLFLSLFLLPAWVGASFVNQCLSCHTDGEKMKTLVKAPTLGGEGEG